MARRLLRRVGGSGRCCCLVVVMGASGACGAVVGWRVFCCWEAAFELCSAGDARVDGIAGLAFA
ncbi:hypothetical protein ACLB1Q_33975 [Escherichia coli]